MIKGRNILIHILICFGFLLMPFLFLAGEMFSFHDVFHNPYDSFNTVFYSLLLIFFYVNYYVLIPKFYIPRKYSIYIGILIAIFLLLFALYYFNDYLPYHPPHHEHEMHPHHDHHDGNTHSPHNDDDESAHHRKPSNFRHPPPVVELSQLVFLYVIGIFVGLYTRLKKNMDMIEQEKNNAEVSYLKSQINPHFLFNTFNSIYSLAIKENADQTANGMLKLSGMMRYVVSESSSDFVQLEKELNYISDFIELQQLRLDKGVKLKYTVEGNVEEKRIAPLLLIPFIENAFKHGVNPDEDSEINIHIHVAEDQLQLLVENKKVSIRHDAIDKMGFGIENTKNRLKLIYPENHLLEITDTNKQYKVNLKLTLI